MSIVVHLFYEGEKGGARRFAEETEASGIVDRIRRGEGWQAFRKMIEKRRTDEWTP